MAQEQQDQANTEISEQVETVLREDGYDGFVRALFNRCGNPAVDFTHAVLGISTEVVELLMSKDVVNSFEEAGDLAFYAMACFQVLDDYTGGQLTAIDEAREWDIYVIKFHELHGEAARMTSPDSLRYLLNELQDVAKRWIGYGKAYPHHPATLVVHVNVICALARELAVGRGDLGDMGKVIRANVAKLLQRYKGKTFNAEHAVNRDLDAERETLNAAVAAAG